MIARSEELRLLVQKSLEGARLVRRAEQQIRRWEQRYKELEEQSRSHEEQIEKLERTQAACMGEIEDELRAKIVLVDRQREAIAALSAPLLRVGDGVLALPVIGSIDEERAGSLTTRLLDEIVTGNVRFAVIDLTGVESLDQATVEHLIRMFQAIRMLGASPVITGIRGDVARAMVIHGVDLSETRIERSLKDALRYCGRAREREAST